MIDPNGAWNWKEAVVKLTAIRDAGVEDPILRNDFEGLRTLRHAVNCDIDVESDWP
ncbi:hypothetical protein [Phyllobacterium bourgognense]|uniref:Uncharacterized protein n=1 Tax=Phyllobacterium bourgognense TaxID=314236 RepID=A0A368YNS0_9HYPH|nr:hypothetical protein [Phyllobacterium bourgognense]RCW81249.1 hypothetical protein C7476_111111 [Phyllobacterium bourgognense]